MADKENRFNRISISIASPDQIKDWAKRTSCRRRNPASDTWSCPEKGTCDCGEIKKAETINYRSFRPEHQGLFCEATFGPQKDFECSCGKYKRIKHKGLICDQCGVEVTKSQVRRERLGYIKLATPVSHIWFFKGIPSRLGTFLELASRQVERVLYFEAFIVTEVIDDSCGLAEKDILTEAEVSAKLREHPDSFRAGTGAEAIQELLSKIDLPEDVKKFTEELEATSSHQKKVKLSKQLKMVAGFDKAEMHPDWMILDVLPVISPDLRPLVSLEGGRFATSDLNDLYRRVINRNNRLQKLIDLRSPEVILRNEKRMLQESVDAFLDNGRHGRRVTGPGKRALKSLSDILKGKVGRFRQNLLGKRVDYSGRSVIVVGPELELHQCGVPKLMAVELFKPFIIEKLLTSGKVQTIKRGKYLTEHVTPDSPVWEALEEVIADHPVLLNRPPTLHRLGIQAFMPVLVEGKSIRIPPLVCKAFNADFDGDQMAVHVPLSIEARAEAKMLLLSSGNILKPSHGEPITVPELDMILGASFLTKALPEHQERASQLHAAYTEKSKDTESDNVFASLESEAWAKRRFTSVDEVTHAHGCGTLKLHDSVLLFFKEHHEPILTTVGRVIFNEVLPHTNGTASLTWKDETTGLELPFFNEEARSRRLSQLVKRCFNELGTAETVSLLDRLQKLSFEYATRSGISPGIKDYLIPLDKTDILGEASKQIQRLSEQENLEAEELENQKIRIWFDAIEKIEETMFTELPTTETYLVEQDKKVEGFSPVHLMADSGARARKNPFVQISAIVGLKSKQSGEILSAPIQSSYREGLDVLDYFTSTYGSRKGLVDTAMKTAASGYLTRKLVDVAQDVMIAEEDCGTTHGILKFTTSAGSIGFKISGRVAVEPVIHPTTEEMLVESDTLITPQMAEIIEAAEVPSVRVRSILTCEAEKGVCAACYGADLTSGQLANVGEAIGIIAAQSIGEPGTQLTMRTFHTGGVVEDMSERLARKIMAKATGKVRFRDFIPGRTVHEKDGLWIVEQVAEHLDQPKYKVKTVQHPECKLQPDELLTEKQYQENLERFPGFEVEPITYEVVKVTRPDVVEANGGADFPLQEGQYLTEQEYNAYFHKFSPFRCSEPHYRVKSVKHPKTSLKEGTLLTESEAETWRAEIRPFDGEWVYETKKGVILTESEYLQKQNSVKAEMKYQIQRVTHPSCPFKEGKLLSPDEESQYHMELDEPVYTVTEVSDGIDLTVDQELTAAEFRRAQETFRTFDVQRPSTQLYRVTKVMHPECPLKSDELIEIEKLETLRDKFSGFTAERLKYRITAVHHPDCKLEPEKLLTENEKKAVLKEYPGFEVDVTKNEEGFEVERLYRIAASHHPEFPVAVDEFITQSESNRYRRNYKGFDFEKLYLYVPEGTETEETLTEADYKALVKQHRDTDAPLPNIKLVYHVLAVHHAECPFAAGQRIDEEEYKRAQRLYKGFDTERAFKVTGVSETDAEIAVGDILSDADYKKESASTSKNTYRVTKVIHPNCTLTIDQELKDWEYATALEQYAGVDVDGLVETFRIDVDITGGGSVSHLIPAGYSVSVKDGQSVKAQHPLAELHEKTTNLDIVAGIPRVTELFEARRPKREDAAEIAEIDGYVQLTGQKAGVPQYRIVDGATKSRLYSIPDEKRLPEVDDGEWVKAGEPLTEGYLNPHDILAIGRTTLNGHSLEGEEALWTYLVDEVQKVYGANTINDKHVEVIVRQMLQKIRILTVGDTKFYANDEVSRHKFHAENRRVEQDGGTPATGEPVLQSISKASLSTDSFISAASFQQTPKVLTDAAVEGQTDMLTGLKENVILGRLIPAGTGFSEWHELEVSHDAIANTDAEELPEPVAEPELIAETVEE